MTADGDGTKVMGASVTHCIPKAEVHDEAVVAVHAGEPRPLTMMQPPSTVVALVANGYLGHIALRTIAGQQRGCVRDRRMETSVLACSRP